MSFLNGALLPALFWVAALPLLIHLLNLRFPKLLEFSSIKEIRKTLAQRSRIFRWRHVLLLAVRTLAICALLLAFLKPMLPRFGSAAPSAGGRLVLLLVDHSLSMEYKGGGISSRARAAGEAQKILATLGPEDAVNVMLVGATPTTCFVDFSHSVPEAANFVESMGPGLAGADFTQANAAVARLLAKGGQRAEIYYLSDFQRPHWSQVDFSRLPPEVRFFFVDAGAKNAVNRGVLGATINQSQVLAGESVALEIEVGNFSDVPMREPLKVVLDARVSFEKEVSVAPWSVARVTLPVPAGAPGLHLCEINLAPDDLPQDDRFFLTLPVLEKEGILLVGGDGPGDGGDGARYLKTALNPYENQAGSILPEPIKASELSATRLATVRKVFLNRAGPLSEPACRALADFLFQGGGMVYFLDGPNDAANLAALQRALGNTPLPIALGKKRVAQNVGTGARQIGQGDFKSRFLRLFRGSQRQNLALLEFYDLYDASATGSGQVLLRYADETPAMASLNHGLGTLLLMNFSISELSSNLARQRLFPAWMQDIVKNLASDEPVPTSSRIGEPVEAEVWKSDLTAAPLRKPSGAPLLPRTEAMGQRAAISFIPDELGFYSMRAERLLHAFAVNAQTAESDLRPIERELLPEVLEARGRRGFLVGGREDFENLVAGRPVFHWFVLAALGLLGAEALLQLFLKGGAAR